MQFPATARHTQHPKTEEDFGDLQTCFQSSTIITLTVKLDCHLHRLKLARVGLNIFACFVKHYLTLHTNFSLPKIWKTLFAEKLYLTQPLSSLKTYIMQKKKKNSHSSTYCKKSDNWIHQILTLSLRGTYEMRIVYDFYI